jgi:hypothetical protein
MKVPVRIDLMWIQIQFRIQGFVDQQSNKIYSWKTFLYFFDQNLQFTYP